MTGPISDAIAQKLLDQVRQHGIVLWMDPAREFTGFVDAFAQAQQSLAHQGKSSLPVVGFRGSFLEMMLALEPYGDGIEKQPLLIHMPGFDRDSIKNTPVLELFYAGTEYSLSLESVIRECATGRLLPAQTEQLLQSNTQESPVTVASADQFFHTVLSAAATSGKESSLIPILEGEDGSLYLLDALGGQTAKLAKHVTNQEQLSQLFDFLEKLTGFTSGWDLLRKDIATMPVEKALGAVLENWSSWLLCVEYVHDLRREPKLSTLDLPKAIAPNLVLRCCELLAQFREKYPQKYQERADEVENVIADEFKDTLPEDLGRIDTFRIEGVRMLEGAVHALQHGEWEPAKQWANERPQKTFWLANDSSRSASWALVEMAVALFELMEQHANLFTKATSFEDVCDEYCTTGYLVDRAHRRFERQRLSTLRPQLPQFSELLEMAKELATRYQNWSNSLAQSFARFCKAHGMLPPSSLMQRNVYEEVIQPWVRDRDKVVVFLVDALRYELATELYEQLKDDSVRVVQLKARFAELPTVTKVGMNAIAPLASQDRLVVNGLFAGLKRPGGEFAVSDPESRVRAMAERNGVRKGEWISWKLEDVLRFSTERLRHDVTQHKLIVVHSREIDDAGESNFGLRTFGDTMDDLRSAWQRLELAGVKHFVFTADHGFLLQPPTGSTVRYESGDNPSERRWVFSKSPLPGENMLSVSTADLGYEGLSGYLGFRDDTLMFERKSSAPSFVHGGNSPQERIVPVLTVTRELSKAPSTEQYAIELRTEPDERSLHRLSVRVVKTGISLHLDPLSHLELSLKITESASPESVSPSAIRAQLKPVDGPGAADTHSNGSRVSLAVGGEWVTLLFSLEAASDTRAKVALWHPDGKAIVIEQSSPHWYSVVGQRRDVAKALAAQSIEQQPLTKANTASRTTAKTTSKPTSKTESNTAPEPSAHWSMAIEDEGARKVFLHLEKYNAILEEEVTRFVGSPRAFRQFALHYEKYLSKLPFNVVTEVTGTGKRYVKDGTK